MSSHKNKDLNSDKSCKCGNVVCECTQKKDKNLAVKEDFSISTSKGNVIQVSAGVPSKNNLKQPDIPAPLASLLTMHLEEVGRALQDKGFVVSIAGTVEDALEIVGKRILPERKGNLVSFGGSTSVVSSGLFAAIKNNPELDVIDTYDTSVGPEVAIERRRQALLSDLFITSVNAITRNGKLLWLDGIGNRTAAVQFGPRQVVILAGRNKICEDVDAGIKRIKNIAAPANVVRLKRNTPCAKTGHCMDCKSPESVCTAWTVMRRCNPAGRIHVILVNEDLGF